jgi:hypothetical protein
MNTETKKRAYAKLRDIVKKHNGSMNFERKGRPRGGAWIISVKDKSKTIRSSRIQSFRELDELYVLKRNCENPKTWDDYDNELIEGAEDKLLAMLE